MTEPRKPSREGLPAAWVARWPGLLGRGLRVLVSAVILGLIIAAAGHLYLNSSGVLETLQRRAETSLKDRGLDVRLGALEVDWLGRVKLDGVAVASQPGGPAVLKARTIRIRPSYRALLRTRLVAASVLFEGLDVYPGPHGQNLRDFWHTLKSRPVRTHAGDASLETHELPLFKVDEGRLWVESSHPGVPPVELGPVTGELSVERDFTRQDAEARLRLPGRGLLRLEAHWGREEAGSIELWLKDLKREVLPDALSAKLPVQLQQGTSSFHVRVDFPANLRTGVVGFDTQTDDLVAFGERLAPQPVGPLGIATQGTMRWDRTRRKLRLEEGVVALGKNGEMKVGITGEGSYADPFNFRLDAHLDRLPYQDALDALPQQLTPGQAAPRLDGPLSAQLTLQGVLTQPDDWTLSVNLDMSKLKETARGTPFKLKGPFLYETRDHNGRAYQVWVGEKNPTYVPFNELPPYVYRAVTTSEDAGFFAHHGFDFQEMKNSFVSVAKEERFRGASTITQQLAKNLFLTRERTYARKVREALITIALESALSKQRLMEIYLNIIEWGPGVYGVGPAARHYFGKDARHLTVKEAAFLATIIPNPIKYHVYFTRGELTDVWRKRVHELLVKMHDENVITDAEYILAETTPIVFTARGTSVQGMASPGREGRRAGERL